MMSSPYYDERETRTAQEREMALMAALQRQIAHAQARSPMFSAILAGVDAAQVRDRQALEQLPVTRKHDLRELQGSHRQGNGASGLFGGFSALVYGPDLPRVFASPGPIYELQGKGRDYWRMGRALYAAGFRRGELVHNAFSYHFVPAGAMMEAAAHALGCTVFAAGTGQTEQQVRAIADLCPAGYVGTPSFLRLIVERAQALGVRIPSLAKALLSAEAFPPSLRDWLITQGIQGFQCYGTADVGLIAYETSAREGLVLDEDLIVEIVHPGTGTPVPDGEMGELVVTNLNPDYPLIRFGTGDLSAVLPGQCATGRTNKRIRGWLGRTDQATKIRGMFVYPSQVAEIVGRFPEIHKARLVVDGRMSSDEMILQVEVGADPDGLQGRIADAMREVTKLRGEVHFTAPGGLPEDGRLIEDRRSYD
ncbi:phenylacetate--CoA ligase family protein [Castellaniella sp.]|uniref:phenylacetate--CoA ligase family protein n=1 Tax=Castellaniella sp. TaxID=1955812 RepID=UPI003560B38C